jgi:hypothetical protein
LEHVAEFCDRRREWFRFKRAVFESIGAVAEDNLVDLGRRKPSRGDRH